MNWDEQIRNFRHLHIIKRNMPDYYEIDCDSVYEQNYVINKKAVRNLLICAVIGIAIGLLILFAA